MAKARAFFHHHPRSHPLEGPKAWWPFGLLTLLLLAADQGSKAWAESHLSLGQAGPWLVQGQAGGLRLLLAHPIQAHLGPWVLHPHLAGWLASMLGLATVALFVGRSGGSAIRLLGLAWLAGGFISLGLDRMRLGHAVGWLSLVPWLPGPYGLADAALLAGLVLLVLDGAFPLPLSLRKPR